MTVNIYQKFSRWYDSCEVPQDVYAGWKKVFIPLDLVFSKFAKHSYPMYRVWNKWIMKTNSVYAKHQIAGAPTTENFSFEPKLVEEIKEKGFTVIEQAFSEEDIQKTREYILGLYEYSISAVKTAENVKTDEEGISKIWTEESGITYTVIEEKGRYRFMFPTDPEKLKKMPDFIQAFAALPVTHQIIEDYYDMRVYSNQPYVMAEVMIPNGEVESWHIDCFRKGCKAFLYLNEVKKEQGPLRYLEGSHKVEDLDKQIFRVGRSGLGEAYYDDKINAEYDKTGKYVTAPGNSLVIFDNQGVHAGSLCSEGIRVALVNSFRPVSSKRINPRMLPNLPAA